MSRRHEHAGRRRSAAFAAPLFALGLALFLPGVAAAAEKTVTIVDPSPVNWLSVTWNTMEEAVRVDKDGKTQMALATDMNWIDDKTLEIKLREGVTFQDGEPFTATQFKRSFDEVQKWENPHPPGAFLNFAKAAQMEAVDDHTIRFTMPETDSGAIMKLRGMHVGSTKFWDELAFIDQESKSAEGHW
jgi:ABC-type transport system substrate-binding protein